MPEAKALSHVSYKGDGSTHIYNVPFEYISRDYVYVTIDGIDVGRDRYNFFNSQAIQFFTAPDKDATILIYRDTDKSKPIVDFKNGSVLTEEDLDTIALQLLHIAQEIYDVPGRLQENFEALEEIAKELAGTRDAVSIKATEALHYVSMAREAAYSIQGMTAEATTLEPGEAATAEYSQDSKRLFFGIPRGMPGRQGEPGPRGLPGDQGEKGDAFTYEDFTPEQLEALKGPKGDTGDVGPQGPAGTVPYLDTIDAGGAYENHLDTIDAGTASSFA